VLLRELYRLLTAYHEDPCNLEDPAKPRWGGFTGKVPNTVTRDTIRIETQRGGLFAAGIHNPRRNAWIANRQCQIGTACHGIEGLLDAWERGAPALVALLGPYPFPPGLIIRVPRSRVSEALCL